MTYCSNLTGRCGRTPGAGLAMILTTYNPTALSARQATWGYPCPLPISRIGALR